jgi:hypothetical protein
MKSAFLVLGLVALSSPLLSQNNLIVNGDFENAMTGWTASGGGVAPAVTSEDMLGLAKSNAFSIHPGATVYAPPHPPYILKQSILIIPKVEYEFSADVLSIATRNNAQGGMVEVKIGGVSVFKWDRWLSGIKTGTYREKIAGRFSQLLAGKHDLTIEIQRPKYTAHTGTPKTAIDNLKLSISTRPSVFIAGDRLLGTNWNLNAVGTPGAAVGVFIAPKLFPTTINIPGFKGKFELHLASVAFLLAGALDAKTGMMNVKLPVPNDKNLLGNPLYWEGIEVSATPSIGPAHQFNVTN